MSRLRHSMQFIITIAVTPAGASLKSAWDQDSIIDFYRNVAIFLRRSYSLNTLDNESLVTKQFRSPSKPVRRPCTIWLRHQYFQFLHKSKFTSICHLTYIYIYIGYTMKRRGIQYLDHHRNRLFRHPERIVWGCPIQFPRWSKSCIPRLFHSIRYLQWNFANPNPWNADTLVKWTFHAGTECILNTSNTF